MWMLIFINELLFVGQASEFDSNFKHYTVFTFQKNYIYKNKQIVYMSKIHTHTFKYIRESVEYFLHWKCFFAKLK